MVASNGQLHEIRAYRRRRVAEGADPRDIAREIHARWPDIGRLESWRLGIGWTREEAAEHIGHNVVRPPASKRRNPDASLSASKLAQFERWDGSVGERPGADYQWAIKGTYGISLDDLGIFDWCSSGAALERYSGCGVDAPDDQTHGEQDESDTKRRQALALSGGAALAATTAMMESLALTHAVEGPAGGPATHEQLDLLVQRLAAAMDLAPPPQLVEPVVRRCRRMVAGMLPRQVHPAAERHLRLIAGYLSVLLGILAFDLGDHLAAQAHAVAAFEIARKLGQFRLASRSKALQSMVALYLGQPAAALALAREGRSYARNGDPSAVRLAVQGEGWALARMGDQRGTDEAVRRASAAMTGLVVVAGEPGGVFSFKPAALAGSAGAAYLWVGMPRESLARNREALRLNGSEMEPRAGIEPLFTWLDIAGGQAQLGEVEDACRIMGMVLSMPGDRLIDPIRRRAGEVRATLVPHRALPAVRAVNEQLEAISRPTRAR